MCGVCVVCICMYAHSLCHCVWSPSTNTSKTKTLWIINFIRFIIERVVSICVVCVRVCVCGVCVWCVCIVTVLCAKCAFRLCVFGFVLLLLLCVCVFVNHKLHSLRLCQSVCLCVCVCARACGCSVLGEYVYGYVRAVIVCVYSVCVQCVYGVCAHNTPLSSRINSVAFEIPETSNAKV